MSHLVGIFTAIGIIIYVQLASGWHQQKTAQLRTADAAQATVSETGEETVVGRVGG